MSKWAPAPTTGLCLAASYFGYVQPQLSVEVAFPQLELYLARGLTRLLCVVLLLLLIMNQQVPGATLLGPYRAPHANEELIGYELFFPRVSHSTLLTNMLML